MTKNGFIYALKASGCLYHNGQTYYEENELIRTFEDMEMFEEFEEEKSLKDMTELEHAIKHIKTRADAWAVKVVEEALSEWRCIYDLKNRYCPRLDEHGMLKEMEQQPKCDKDCEDMTREEALDRCKHLVIDTHFWSEDNQIALNMAIKALEQNESAEEWYKLFVKKLDEQEPCTDAVSREAVLNAICDYVAFEEYEDKSHTFTVKPLEKRIDALPSVIPQPCDDAISREEVLECLNDKQMELDGYGDTASAMEIARVRMTINDLPSVTSKPIEYSDAISRDAVFNAIEHEDKWLLAAKGHNGLTEIAFSGLKARVDALPSVTQKSGKWIETEYHRWRCSVCREKGMSEWDNIHDVRTNFCPDCGAKMFEPQESEE